MNELAEVTALVAELGAAYARMTARMRDELHMSIDEADAQAHKPSSGLMNQPANLVSWYGLSTLTEQHPDQAYALWERVKAEARAELDSGYRAARTLDSYNDTAWQRAQFLAIRDSFVEEWKPTGGIEQALIDTMAQAFSCYLYWQETLSSYTNLAAQRRDKYIKENGAWAAPRVSEHEAIENAAAMVDRFNRLFLRTLRQMRDLRRYALGVTIQNAGQVNIGQQQVNAAQIRGEV